MIRNPEQLDALLADVRAFVRDCWHPIENKIELLDEVPADIVKELQQRGFLAGAFLKPTVVWDLAPKN